MTILHFYIKSSVNLILNSTSQFGVAFMLVFKFYDFLIEV